MTTTENTTAVLSPVELLFARFGSAQKIVAAMSRVMPVGSAPPCYRSVLGWRKRPHIPTAHQELLMQAAKNEEIPLTYEELVKGGQP